MTSGLGLLRVCAREYTAASKAAVLQAELMALHALRYLLVTGHLGSLQVGEIAPDTPGKEPMPGATPKTATTAAPTQFTAPGAAPKTATAAPTQITASAGPAAPVAGAKAVKK